MKAPPNLPPGADFSPAFRDFVASSLMTDPSRRGTAKSLLNHPWLTGRPLVEVRPGLPVTLPHSDSLGASPASSPSSASTTPSSASSPASSVTSSNTASPSSAAFGSNGANAPPPDPSAAYVSSYKPPPPGAANNKPREDSVEPTGWKPLPKDAPSIPHIALPGDHHHAHQKTQHQRRPSMMREPSHRLLEQGQSYISPRPQLVRFYWDQQSQGWKERVLTEEEKLKWLPEESTVDEGEENDDDNDDIKDTTSSSEASDTASSATTTSSGSSEKKDDDDEPEVWPFSEPTHQDLSDWELLSDHVIKKEYPRGICHFHAKDHALFDHLAETLGFPVDVTEEAFKRKLTARREEEKKEEEALAANGGVKAAPASWKKAAPPAPIAGVKGGMLQLTLPTDANNREEEQLISLKLPSAVTAGGVVSLQLMDDFGGFPLTLPLDDDIGGGGGLSLSLGGSAGGGGSSRGITMLTGPISPHMLALPQISIISPGGSGAGGSGGFLGEALSAKRSAVGGGMGRSLMEDLAARRAATTSSTNDAVSSSSPTITSPVPKTTVNGDVAVISSVPLRLHESFDQQAATAAGGVNPSPNDPRRKPVRKGSFAHLDLGSIKAATAATAAGLDAEAAIALAAANGTTGVGRARPEAGTIEY
jgi:hypothetical protein